MGVDPKKHNQRWKFAFHEKKWHKIENYLKIFLDQLVQARRMREFVDQEKNKAEEAKVRLNPRFDRGMDEIDDAWFKAYIDIY